MIGSYFRPLCLLLFFFVAGSVYPEDTNQSTIVTQEEVNRYVQSGNYEEACRMYEQIKKTKDSIAKKVYAQEVKALRSTHQIDELYLANKQQQNVLLERLLAYLFLLILALLAVIYYLRDKTRRLLLAEADLLKAKEQAEHSEHEKSVLLSQISVELKGALDDLTHRLASLNEKQETPVREMEQDVEKLQRLMNCVTESEREQG